MFNNWFNADDAAALRRRLEGLKSDGKPLWGSFSAAAVVCHLADPVRVALGEKPAKQLRGPLGLPGISHAVVWVMPWPKGAPTAPEFLPGNGMTRPTEFEHDKRVLLDVLRRLSDVPAGAKLSPSPVFG